MVNTTNWGHYLLLFWLGCVVYITVYVCGCGSKYITPDYLYNDIMDIYSMLLYYHSFHSLSSSSYHSSYSYSL